MSKLQVAFVGAGFGSKGDPLYWGDLWRELAKTASASISILSLQPLVSDDFCTDPTEELERPTRFRRAVYLLNQFTSLQPDAFVFINEFSYASLLAAVFLPLAKRARLIFLVENDPKYLLGYGLNRDGSAHRLYRKFLLRLSRVVVVNNNEGAAYLKRLGVRSEKVICGPYLTSSLSCTRQASTFGTDSVLKIAIVGQLIPRKGIAAALRELAALSNWTRDVHYHIFGSGPDRVELEELKDQLALDRQVHFEGSVPRAELGDRIAECHLVLISSLADYRSLVAFEAISLGMPLIISCYDGSAAETVVPGRNGFIYDPLNPGELAQLLRCLKAGQYDLKMMAIGSREISRHFSVHRAASILTQAIRLACIPRRQAITSR